MRYCELCPQRIFATPIFFGGGEYVRIVSNVLILVKVAVFVWVEIPGMRLGLVKSPQLLHNSRVEVQKGQFRGTFTDYSN